MREMGPRPSTQPGNKADCLIINEAGGEKLGVLNDYALHKSTHSLKGEGKAEEKRWNASSLQRLIKGPEWVCDCVCCECNASHLLAVDVKKRF